ncbi:uncharacterized protein LOC134264767 [Saccostrea cucullata]|uniref:uncharacterized protein LOC134264767 n=1 Tax=Saccostrea cuccullata TaxID=36930 RepID=UPI002ED4D54B
MTHGDIGQSYRRRSKKLHVFPDPAACIDHVSLCHTYDPIICTIYKSWAEIQCFCFCQLHSHGQNWIYKTTSPSTSTPSTQQTSSTTQMMTSLQKVTNQVPRSLSCFTCDDYLTFRCRSFATECDNTCMIRYKDGRLQTKCTLDLECRIAQQDDFLNIRSSTRCCRDNACVSDTLQQAVLVHHKQIGGQTTLPIGMVSNSKTQPTSVTTSQSGHLSTTKPVVKSTTAKSTPIQVTQNLSTMKSSTLQHLTLLQKTTSQKISTVTGSTVNTKSSLVPKTRTTTHPWGFVTLPIGRRRK